MPCKRSDSQHAAKNTHDMIGQLALFVMNTPLYARIPASCGPCGPGGLAPPGTATSEHEQIMQAAGSPFSRMVDNAMYEPHLEGARGEGHLSLLAVTPMLM